jgi:hypothetical protein
LGYHHRELGHTIFVFLYNLIMAGSWSGYLIAFTAWRLEIQAVFWLKTRCSNAPPTRQRPRAETPLSFSSLLSPLLGWIPVGTGARAAG